MWLELAGDQFFQNAVLATLLVGIACPLVGVMVIIMRLSFLGVCMSHAAFAGALLGILLGQNPIVFGFLFSFVAAGTLGPLADRGQLNTDTSMGIIFSLTLGLSFLFLPMISGAKTEALRLLWGSILTVTVADLMLLAVVVTCIVLFVLFFFKEIQAVIFNRSLALSAGIPATLIFYLILFLSGACIVSSLKAIGGLLVFSLIINPAAAANQWVYDLKKMFLLAAGLGVLSGWIGLLLSCWLDLPTGALIILVSTAIFMISVAFSPKRARKVFDDDE